MYQRNTQGFMKHLDFIMLDLVCLHISFLIAFLIRQGILNPYAENVYFGMISFLTFMNLLLSIFLDTYKNVLKRGYYKEFLITIRQACLMVLTSTFYLFTAKQGSEISRMVIYVMGILYTVISYLSRVLWKLYLRRRLTKKEKRSLLIVTTGGCAAEIVEHIRKYSLEMFRIAGVVVTDHIWPEQIAGEDGEAFDIPIVMGTKHMAEDICREWVDEALIHIPQGESFPTDFIQQLTEMGVVVHINLNESYVSLGKKLCMEKIGMYNVLTSSMNYATTGQLFIKRSMDIIMGLLGCFITLLLAVVLAPWIWIKSPGPVFFAQTRVGKNGRKFKMYKFRSMYPDAEERKAELMEENKVADGMMFKLEYDPRIIGCKKLPNGKIKKGIGNFIREFSLDEFPQFWNVLKGEMSIVGTRPPTVDEWEKYELHHRARLAIKPGITGLWQVSGRSRVTDFEEVVKLDARYIEEWNPGKDVKIILQTIKAVFKKDGAM